jgi:hypothetical protein
MGIRDVIEPMLRIPRPAGPQGLPARRCNPRTALRKIKPALESCPQHPPHCTHNTEETTMSSEDTESGDVPFMQQLLDNPFLLLFIGVLVPMLVYTLWGVIDILTIPLAK